MGGDESVVALDEECADEPASGLGVGIDLHKRRCGAGVRGRGMSDARRVAA